MYAMVTASQAPEHRTGIFQIGRLPDYIVIQLDHRVTPQHNRFRLFSRDRLSLASGEALHLFDHRTANSQPLLERWVFDLVREVEARMSGIYRAGEGSTDRSIRSEVSVKLAPCA